MAAQNEGAHVFDRNIEFLGEEIAKARRIEHARHADDPLRRQSGRLLQRPHHDVERIGDADDKGARRIALDARADLGDDAEIDRQKIVAAHPRLARHARRNDDDVRPLDRRIVGAAGELGVEARDGRRLGDVERLALRHAVDNVEKNDVA